MGKHDEKTKHAAHIKRHTVGTSNEISFSVLDAAKNAARRGKRPGGREEGPAFRRHLAVHDAAQEEGHLHAEERVGPAAFDRRLRVGGPCRGDRCPGLAGGILGVRAHGKGRNPRPASREGSGIGSINGVVDGGTTGLGNLGGAGARWPTPADEVARRKTTRKRRRLLAYLLVFLAVAGLAGSAGWWLWQNYQTHQSHVSELD